MDKNQLIGFALLLVIFLGYIWMNPVEEKEETPTTTEISSDSNEVTKPEISNEVTNSIETITLDSAQQALIAIQNQSKFGVFSSASTGNSEDIVLENNKLSIVLDTKGGLFKSATLRDGYKTYWEKTPIQLWNPENSLMDFTFDYQGKGNISTKDFYFTPTVTSLQATESTPASIKLRLNTNDPNKYLEYIYSLANDSYEVKFNLNMVGLDNVIQTNNNPFQMNWKIAGLHQEKGVDDERRYSSIFFREQGEDRDYLGESRQDDEITEKDLNWMDFKQKFFSAMVINDNGFEKGAKLESYPPEDDSDTTTTMFYSAEMGLKVNSPANQNIPLRFYFGPNEFNSLKALEVEEATRIIDYGPWIIGWVNRHVVRPMFFYFSKYIGNAGLVILLITLIIKMALFPVTWKNYLSSAKMRVLKPQIEEINKKFEGKDKAMDKQQATMALYRKTGVNPFAGCIPVLFQMPILYAMFRFFPASIELRGKSFLWAEDLSSYDSILNLPFDIPFYGAHVSGFTLLMAASTFFYTRMNSSNMPATNQPGMPNMKVIMNFFPLMMLFFFNKFSSALSLYYFVANMVSITQMWSIKKWFVKEDKILAKMEEKKKNPKKKSSFQERLEEMQKKQQEAKKKK